MKHKNKDQEEDASKKNWNIGRDGYDQWNTTWDPRDCGQGRRRVLNSYDFLQDWHRWKEYFNNPGGNNYQFCRSQGNKQGGQKYQIWCRWGNKKSKKSTVVVEMG